MSDYYYSSYREYIREKRLITSNSIKLLFGSEYKYIEQFNAIHNELQEIEDIKDVIDYEYNIEELLEKYKNEVKGELIKDEVKFGRILLGVRQKYGISLREMEKIFGINKDKLNKYIHKVIDNG